ncbi:MAG TPA: FkbM family methyltransferase [Solirubrobacteraceae bacterium]|nr:FkbM family methyltransferase [Solirubrobacteraceae bacterium]
MAVAATLRTRLAWGLMRALDVEHRRRAHDRGWLRPVEAVLQRGELRVLGGPAHGSRLSSEHFAHWGAQAWSVLTGTHEPMVHEALRRTLGPGGVFIDVGSNIGYTALLAAGIVGPGGRVVALDAQRECADATRANARLNGLTQIEALHSAAGAASGEAEVIVTQDPLWTRLASVGEHPLEVRRDRVPVTSLDDLVAHLALPAVDVVKIDVEGAELDVVAGMQRVLAGQRPFVIAEMHGLNAAFCAAMAAAGYRVSNLDGLEPVPQAGDNVHALCEPLERVTP